MRLLVIGCFALWVAALTAQTPQQPADPGWSAKRSIYMEDVATTIYSAPGFDWTKKIDSTPSGRTFHYIEPFAARQMIRSQEIAPLFT